MSFRITVVIMLIIMISCQRSSHKNFDSSESKAGYYLQLAQESEEWLAYQSSVAFDGIGWPDIIDEPDKVTLSYSDGMSGGLVFYLKLYQATGDEKYFDRARSIGFYLLDNLPQKTDSIKGKFWAFSPYGNVCGPGFAFTALYEATGQDRFKVGAQSIVELLEHFADNANDTISWDLGNDVLGGLAGTGLFLLHMAEKLENENALQMAIRSGKTLLARAGKEDGHLFWKRGQNSRFVLPNFSHGNAGIGYFFARLYEETSDEKFLDAALSAVAYLDSKAKTDNNTYMIPYGFPDNDWSRDYDIGWAHGPAGVARLFFKLYQVTEDESWIKRMEACYNAVLSANPLGTPTEGFGTEVFSLDQRFGLAGVGMFAQEMYRLTGEKKYLKFTNELLTKIVEASKVQNRRHWPTPRHSFMANAGEETSFTGYFYGNVGYGMLFLNQYSILTKGPKGIRFVDDPF